MRDDALQVFENANRLGAIDGREIVEELGERPIVFEVVEERSHGDTSADEHGRSAKKLRIGVYAWDRLSHGALVFAGCFEYTLDATCSVANDRGSAAAAS